jgi:DnaK suppressor protein
MTSDPDSSPPPPLPRLPPAQQRQFDQQLDSRRQLESLQGLREQAAAQVAALEADLLGLFEASRSSNADDEHDPEGATIGFERAQLTALLAGARARIAEIDDALRRDLDGTYGVCERCGRPIAPERLVARPFARHCIACA